MTLAQTSPVKRETSVIFRRRALIVEITAHAAIIRAKGTRDRVVVPWEAALDLGYKLAHAKRGRKSDEGTNQHRRSWMAGPVLV